MSLNALALVHLHGRRLDQARENFERSLDAARVSVIGCGRGSPWETWSAASWNWACGKKRWPCPSTLWRSTGRPGTG